MENFKRYCEAYFRVLYHPFRPSNTVTLDPLELEEAIDLVCQIVGAPVSEPRLANLDTAFDAAFAQYLIAPRDQVGGLHNAVERLAGFLEPFLKKLTYLCYPDRTCRKGRKSRPLWHFGMEDILYGLKIAEPGLDKTDPIYWEAQPVEQAMWRIALISRHKGAHEAHRYGLVEMERIATAVVGCYLLSARFALKDKTSQTAKLVRSTEVRRLEELMTIRTQTYRITGDLPGEPEHLRLYSIRGDISIREDEAHLLFQSHLAGNGPVHYFLQSITPPLLVDWAHALRKHPKLQIRRNAVEFLISAGETIPLKEMVDLYADYKFRFRLARHIEQYAKAEDVPLLWRLHRHKSETVRVAVLVAFVGLVTDRHYSLLRKAGTSSSVATKELFFRWALKLADPSKLSGYRQEAGRIKGARQRLAMISLAMVGSRQDLCLLERVLRNRRTSRSTRETAASSVALLAGRLNHRKPVRSVVGDGRTYIASAGIRGLSYGASEDWVKSLLRLYKKHPAECSEAIMRCATKRQAPAIMQLLRKVQLDNHAKKLALSLLKIDARKAFSFLMKLFAGYRHPISFWEQYELIFPMAETAAKGRGLRKVLRKLIEPAEFWQYYGATRPKSRMPIAHYENIPLIKRIAGLSFGEVALRKDRPLLIRMLQHSYWSVYHGAANGLYRIGTEGDLIRLVDLAVGKGQNTQEIQGFLDAIAGLDAKLYSRIATRPQNQLAFGDSAT